MNRRLKSLGALLLLVSLAFPIAKSCSGPRYEDAEGKPVFRDKNDSVPPGTRVVERYQYVLDNVGPTSIDFWGRLSLFTWPVVVLAILIKSKKLGVVLAMRILEPLLIVWSAATVELVATMFTRGRASGAYIAFTALGIYALGALWEDIAAFRNWRKARRVSA